jgi:hypothetical protein
MLNSSSLNRRRLLGLFSVTFVSYFCYLQRGSAIAFSTEGPANQRGFSRSGDDDLDLALIAELKGIVRVLEVNPGFQYIDEMNAFAMEASIIPGTKGTVMLGLPLVKQLMELDDGGAGVAGVCAHECGHVYQFEHGLAATLKDGKPTVAALELHADFLAGYYFSRRKSKGFDHLLHFLNEVAKMGDFNFKSVFHHGSPQQRAAAADRGYNLGLEGMSIAEAAQRGVTIILDMVEQGSGDSPGIQSQPNSPLNSPPVSEGCKRFPNLC